MECVDRTQHCTHRIISIVCSPTSCPRWEQRTELYYRNDCVSASTCMCAGVVCAGAMCAGVMCADGLCAGAMCAGAMCAGAMCAGAMCADGLCAGAMCADGLCVAYLLWCHGCGFMTRTMD